ncbi:MAG: hypothetical protein AB1489_08670 [Acidobacteriota bacterium]
MPNSEQGKESWLARLSAKIPGYRGYLEKERRRDVDKLYRDQLANQLQQLKSPLNEVVCELSNNGRLMEVKNIEPITNKLDRIENRIRYASYGYSGFFDIVKVTEQELDRLYNFDLGLAENIEAIKAQIATLFQRADSADNLKTAASMLEHTLDELNIRFNERHKTIESFDSESCQQGETHGH